MRTQYRSIVGQLMVKYSIMFNKTGDMKYQKDVRSLDGIWIEHHSIPEFLCFVLFYFVLLCFMFL